MHKVAINLDSHYYFTQSSFRIEVKPLHGCESCGWMIHVEAVLFLSHYMWQNILYTCTSGDAGWEGLAGVEGGQKKELVLEIFSGR